MIKSKELNRCLHKTGCADAEAVRGRRRGSKTGNPAGKSIVAALIMGLSLSVTACGDHEKGVANPDTTQTSFAIMGGQSALSPGYTDNVVLKDLQTDTGILIDWTTMSESLAEQVNIRIAGEELASPLLHPRRRGSQSVNSNSRCPHSKSTSHTSFTDNRAGISPGR